MYINKPLATKIKTADRVNLAEGSDTTNIENLAKCFYPSPDMRHFMIVTKRTLAFRQRN